MYIYRCCRPPMRTKPQRSASIKTTPQAIRRSARAIAVEPFILISDSKAKSNDSRCGRSHDLINMQLDTLTAISPIDGRYRSKCEPLADYFSEFALIRYRVRVEVEYFIALCEIPLPQLAGVPLGIHSPARHLYLSFTEADAAAVKEIERTTNHDVKAVEYFLKQRLRRSRTRGLQGVHTFRPDIAGHQQYGCPDVDTRGSQRRISPPDGAPAERARPHGFGMGAEIPMLAKTHGQPASPTRLGKEMGYSPTVCALR